MLGSANQSAADPVQSHNECCILRAMNVSRRDVGRKWPVTTLAVLTVTAAVTASQLWIPSVLPTFKRVPNEIADGEYWRLGTSLLVHDGGWRQIVFNLSLLLVAGVWTERLVCAGEWLLLYFAAGISGQVAGLFWQPSGAGNSVASCGLVGTVACWMLRSPRPPFRFGGALLLLGSGFLVYFRDIHGPPLLTGATLALLIFSSRKL
jgi:rhomboid protease GluP